MSIRFERESENKQEAQADSSALRDAQEKSESYAGGEQLLSAHQTFAHPEAANPKGLLQLQRRVGNNAVQRMLESRRLQAKLKVGGAGDSAEREADQMAERVMLAQASGDGRGAHTALAPSSQAAHTEAQGTDIQPADAHGAGTSQDGFEVEGQIETRLAQRAGQGSRLPNSLREQMENSFGADFSDVRVHAGSEAAELNRSLDAQAFTYGPDIYFDEGKYRPHDAEGQRLLAHELTHVVQQGAAGGLSRDVSRSVLRRAPKPGAAPAKPAPAPKPYQPVTLGQLDTGGGQSLEIKRLEADGDGLLMLPPEPTAPAAGSTATGATPAAPATPATPTNAPAPAATEAAPPAAQPEAAAPALLKQNKRKEWEPVPYEQLADSIKSRLVTNQARLEVKNGYTWFLMEFRYADEPQAKKRWAQSKSKPGELASSDRLISSEIPKLPANLQSEATRYSKVISVLSSIEGNFSSTSGAKGSTLAERMKGDTSASLGIFQWAHDRAKVVGRGSTLGDFFYTLKRRADEAAKTKEADRTDEQKLYIAAWKQCTDLGLDFEGDTLTMKNPAPAAPAPAAAPAAATPAGGATPATATPPATTAPAAAPPAPKTHQVTSDELERQLGGPSGEMGKGALRTYQLIAALDWIKKVEDTIVRPGVWGEKSIGNGYNDWGDGKQAFFKRQVQGTNIEIVVNMPAAHETVKSLLPTLKQTATIVMLHVNRPHFVETALWRALISHIDSDPATTAGQLLDQLSQAALADAQAAYEKKNSKKPYTPPKRLQLFGKDKAQWGPEAQQAYDALAALIWPSASAASDLQAAPGAPALKPEEIEKKRAELSERLRLEFIEQSLPIYPGASGHGREKRFAEVELESW